MINLILTLKRSELMFNEMTQKFTFSDSWQDQIQWTRMQNKLIYVLHSNKLDLKAVNL